MDDSPESETPTPTPFAEIMATTLTKALAALRAEGVIEVEERNVEGLATEVIEAVLELRSPKKIPMRVTKTLLRSELVEEVYGSDTEISTILRRFLEEI